MLLELLADNRNLLTIKVHLVLPCSKKNVNQSNHEVSSTLCGLSTGPSNDTVLQQWFKVLIAGGGRGLLVAAREGRVDVDASQRGHRLFAV